jgi:hypothetical protein
MYDLAANTIKHLPSMTTARYGFASALLHNHIYSMTGLTNNNNEFLTTSIERFNILTREWQSMPPLMRGRYGAVAAAHGNSIFIFGGEGGQFPGFCSVQRFDVDNDDDQGTGTWHNVPGLHSHPFDAAAVTVQDRIYLMGGVLHGGGYLSNRVHIFDTTDNLWYRGADMPIASSEFTLATHGKWIFLVGGTDVNGRPVKGCYLFDTQLNEWHESPVKLDRSVRDHSTLILDEGANLLVVGGRCHDTNQNVDIVEEIITLALFPEEIRNIELRTLDARGRLPIHIAAENGLEWDRGMRYIVSSYSEGLERPNEEGDLPVIIAASGTKVDLGSLFNLIKLSVGLSLCELQDVST